MLERIIALAIVDDFYENPEIVREIEDYLKTARTEPRKYIPEPPTAGYRREDTGYIR